MPELTSYIQYSTAPLITIIRQKNNDADCKRITQPFQRQERIPTGKNKDSKSVKFPR